MRVCIISFDYWGFDHYIIKELRARDVEATHININNFVYKHPSLLHKIANAANKLLYKKNIKKSKRQEWVLKQLEALPTQDVILTIRPDLLDVPTHLNIKSKSKLYYAYLYDSTRRFNINHLLNGVFDKIFSFDENDVKKYNFIHITNYIYLPKQDIKPSSAYDYKVFIVISGDERLTTLNAIADKLNLLSINYKFIVRASRKPINLNAGIEYTKEEIWQDKLIDYLDKSEILLDLIRDGHNGLSFRIFESMAYQKKLITTNQSVKNYDFYTPDNIMVVDPENITIDEAFFTTPYTPLDAEVYNKYTITNWVTTVFFK